MPESTLSLGYTDFIKAVGIFLGYGRSMSAYSSDQASRTDEIVQSGLRWFYYPQIIPGQQFSHEWSFLKPVATLATAGAYSTGTVTSSGTTVTLSGGVWPSWVVDHGTLTVNSTDYSVATRSSDTEIILSSAPTTPFSGDTYTMARDGNYDLGDDYGGIEGKLTFDEDEAFRELPIVGEGIIRAERQYSVGAGKPKYAAIRPKAATGSTGQRFEIMLWPTPDAVYHLTYRYKVLPGKLSVSYPYPYGGMAHGETIKAACLAVAELEMDDTEGPRLNAFLRRLTASIDVDRRANATKYFGYNGDGSDLEDRTPRRSEGYYTLVEGSMP